MTGHPAAALFPLLEGADLQRIVDSMKTHGFDPSKPVLIFRGEVLDGRNRMRAAELAGVEAVLRDVSDEVEDPFLESWKHNGARRDLEPDQRVAIRKKVLDASKEWQATREAAKRKANEAHERSIAEQPRDERGRVKPKPVEAPRGAQTDKAKRSDEGKAARDLAKDAGVSTRTAERVLALEKKAPERFEAVARGETKANAELRAIQKAETAAKITAEPAPLPTGPFRVIVADPPWPYEKRAEDSTHRGANPYPVMTIADICAMPVASMAHEDSVLWLWTTNAFLRESFAVLNAWGFREKTMLTWAKNKMGAGDWLRGKTEHCILAVRGKPVVTLTNETTLLVADVREHSRKPESFYSLVETLCPGSKVELFAREPRDGWQSWGAESSKFGGQAA